MLNYLQLCAYLTLYPFSYFISRDMIKKKTKKELKQQIFILKRVFRVFLSFSYFFLSFIFLLNFLMFSLFLEFLQFFRNYKLIYLHVLTWHADVTS